MNCQRRTDTSFANPLVGRREMERRQQHHRENISKIKSSIDTRAPAAQPHLTLYGRDYVAKKRATTEAAFSDLKMIQTIARTMTRNPSIPARKGPISLNAGARKSEIVRVMQENHRLLGRLETLDPVVTTKDFIRDHQWKQRYVINASHTKRLSGEYDSDILRIRREDKSLMDAKSMEADRRRSRHMASQSMSSSMSAPSLMQQDPTPGPSPSAKPRARRPGPVITKKEDDGHGATGGSRGVRFEPGASGDVADQKRYPVTPYAPKKGSEIFVDDDLAEEEPFTNTATSPSALAALAKASASGNLNPLLPDSPAGGRRSPQAASHSGSTPKGSSTPHGSSQASRQASAVDKLAAGSLSGSLGRGGSRTPQEASVDKLAAGSLSGSLGRGGSRTPQDAAVDKLAAGSLSGSLGRGGSRTPQESAVDKLAAGSLSGSLGRGGSRTPQSGSKAGSNPGSSMAYAEGTVPKDHATSSASDRDTAGNSADQEFDPDDAPEKPADEEDEEDYDEDDEYGYDDGSEDEDAPKAVGGRGSSKGDYSYDFDGEQGQGSSGRSPGQSRSASRSGGAGSRSGSGSGSNLPEARAPAAKAAPARHSSSEQYTEEEEDNHSEEGDEFEDTNAFEESRESHGRESQSGSQSQSQSQSYSQSYD